MLSTERVRSKIGTCFKEKGVVVIKLGRSVVGDLFC